MVTELKNKPSFDWNKRSITYGKGEHASELDFNDMFGDDHKITEYLRLKSTAK
jgi:hypothetical protein